MSAYVWSQIGLYVAVMTVVGVAVAALGRLVWVIVQGIVALVKGFRNEARR